MKRTVLVEVTSRGGDEPIERMIKRFSRKVKKERIIERLRERRYYEKPSEVRKKKAKKRKKVLDNLRKKSCP
jgi:small subunit ribosomal protein S21